MGYQVTEFDVEGGYNSHKDQVIMTIVQTKDYPKVTNQIKQIDEKAFFVVTDSYQMSKGA